MKNKTWGELWEIKISEKLNIEELISDDVDIDMQEDKDKLIISFPKKEFILNKIKLDEELTAYLSYLIQNPVLQEEIFENANIDTLLEMLLPRFDEFFINPFAKEFKKITDKNLLSMLIYQLSEGIKGDINFLFTILDIHLEDYKQSSLSKYDVIERFKANTKINETEVQNMNFSLSKRNSEDIFDALDAAPEGYTKREFKSRVMTIYDVVYDDFEKTFETKKITPIRKTDFHFFIDKTGKNKVFVTPANNFMFYLKSKGSLYRYNSEFIKMPIFKEDGVTIEQKDGIVLPCEVILDYFLSISSTIEIESYSKTCQYFNLLTQAAFELINHLNFKPKVSDVDDNLFTIKYIVDKSDKKVKNIIEQLKEMMPEDIFFVENTDKTLGKEHFEYLLNIFVNYIMWKYIRLKASKFKGFNNINVFLKEDNFKSKKGQINAKNSLKKWLAPLDFTGHRVLPIVKIEEKDNGKFIIAIDFTNIQTKEIFNLKTLKESFPEDYDDSLKLLSSLDYILPSILHSAIEPQTSPEFELGDIYKFFINTQNIFSELGIKIVIPKKLSNIHSPKLRLKSKIKQNKEGILADFVKQHTDSKLSVDDIMDFSFEVAIGDKTLSKEEFIEIAKNQEGLIKYKDEYILLEPEKIKKMLKDIDKPIDNKLNSLELLHTIFSRSLGEYEIEIEKEIEDIIKDSIKEVDAELPKGLQADLRPYQKVGFKWLYSNMFNGFGSCIADDMGLGKTLQVISVMLKLKEENKLDKPCLVICPTTLVGNWLKECERFAPALTKSIYHGLDRILDVKSDIILTTYSILRLDIEKLVKQDWQMVIIDEAQNIKNTNTAQTLAVKSLKAPHFIAMTGTPIENKLSELWSIFDFANKGYLGTVGDFKSKYAIAVERYKDKDVANRLKMATSPFVLRRLKTDKAIITDLPEKIVKDEYCYLAKEQAVLYEKTLNDMMKSINEQKGINRRGYIFKLITNLKQICNHPYHYLSSGLMDKNLSGKAEKTLSILDTVIESNEKAIIFTQYKQMGDILSQMIERELNQKPLFFHGSVQRKDRDDIIERFQNDEDEKVMILSLKAGGTGLNLTSATNVIHYDLWWNPAVENQATDRTYRIGQDKNVLVHRLITLGTFEEKIDEIIKSKAHLSDMTLFTGEKFITEMSDDELFNLLSLTNS